MPREGLATQFQGHGHAHGPVVFGGETQPLCSVSGTSEAPGVPTPACLGLQHLPALLCLLKSLSPFGGTAWVRASPSKQKSWAWSVRGTGARLQPSLSPPSRAALGDTQAWSGGGCLALIRRVLQRRLAH